MVRLTLTAIFSCCLCLLEARAQVSPPKTPHGSIRNGITAGTYRSVSGQFIVHGTPATEKYYIAAVNEKNVDWVRLEPALLAVTCERIKKSLLTTLGLPNDQWRDTIAVHLHPASSLRENVFIAPIKDGNRWNYEMEMPDLLERANAISAISHAVLLELANRSADRSAEIPAWLVQGLAQEMAVTTAMDLVVEPPNRGQYSPRTQNFAAELIKHEGHWSSPLSLAHDQLTGYNPLTPDELFWPADAQSAGTPPQVYRGSAQLLVHELLQLPEGRSAMIAFIQDLPAHYNWQLAFLPAFQRYFASELEFERWWALRVVGFTGHDARQLWNREESAKKITETLRVPVEIRTKPDELPLASQMTLQAIIRDWELPRQQTVLQPKITELMLLRTRVSPLLAPTVDAYRETLETYLKKREKDGITPMGRALRRPGLDDLGRDLIRQLDVLDAKLKGFSPPAEATQAAK